MTVLGERYAVETRRGPGGRYRILDRTPINGTFAIRLPSGLCHAFDTLDEARASQYWPFETPICHCGEDGCDGTPCDPHRCPECGYADRSWGECRVCRDGVVS